MKSIRTGHAFGKTVLILLLAGALPGIVVSVKRPASTLTVLADVTFSQASLFLLWGLMHLLGNLHVFTSFTYGMRKLRELIANRQRPSAHAKDDYLHYRNARPHHNDVKQLMTCAGILVVVSLVFTLLAIR